MVNWGMKRPRVMALAAGTVFEILGDNLPDDIGDIFYNGFGIRTEEGFGQVRFWQPQNFTKIKFEEELKVPKLSAFTINLAQEIIRNRFLQQIRISAQEDADKLRISGNLTHFFTRLENILMRTDKNKVRADFKTQIEIEMRDGSLFKDHLQEVQLDNQTLYDIFMMKAELPYKNRDLKNIPAELVKLLKMQNVNFDNEICFEYLKTYFRYARKKSAGGGKNE